MRVELYYKTSAVQRLASIRRHVQTIRQIAESVEPSSVSVGVGNYDLQMWLRVRGSVSRIATVAGMPVVAGTVSETAAVVTTVVFGTNAWQPWSLIVTNGIA
jgi:hypothetical protein